jgi:predicted secreted hydrolase
MRRALCLLALLSVSPAAEYRLALPGYRYEFPRDHFNHPQYRTEWWYYTGNLRTAGGHRYGFELVFFRQGQPSGQASQQPVNASAWRVDDLYLAHLALTDIDGGRFHSWRRLNRAGPGIAGASFDEGRIWNGNWQACWDKSSSTQTLSAIADGLRFTLRLVPRKPPVVHGENGVSQTGDGPGMAAYYVSFTRLAVDGTLNGSPVSGVAWMDHEWFTTLLDPSQRGWDWFSVQLDNSTEFMLFQIRLADGGTDAHSAGTFVDARGRASQLSHSEFELRPMAYWTSPKTGARYPVKWHISVPSRKLEADCVAALPDQELALQGESERVYWEGAVAYSGATPGIGYLEMTGYAQALHM